MRRALWNISFVLCLTLLALTVGMWIRSYYRSDMLGKRSLHLDFLPQGQSTRGAAPARLVVSRRNRFLYASSGKGGLMLARFSYRIDAPKGGGWRELPFSAGQGRANHYDWSEARGSTSWRDVSWPRWLSDAAMTEEGCDDFQKHLAARMGLNANPEQIRLVNRHLSRIQPSTWGPFGYVRWRPSDPEGQDPTAGDRVTIGGRGFVVPYWFPAGILCGWMIVQLALSRRTGARRLNVWLTMFGMIAGLSALCLIMTGVCWVRSQWKCDTLTCIRDTFVFADELRPIQRGDFLSDSPPSRRLAFLSHVQSYFELETHGAAWWWQGFEYQNDGGDPDPHAPANTPSIHRSWEQWSGPPQSGRGIPALLQPERFLGFEYGFTRKPNADVSWPGDMLVQGRFAVPWWFLMLAFALAPAAFARVLLRRRRRLNRIRAGQCESCGYDLRASTECCPECGRIIKRTSLRCA